MQACNTMYIEKLFFSFFDARHSIIKPLPIAALLKNIYFILQDIQDDIITFFNYTFHKYHHL